MKIKFYYQIDFIDEDGFANYITTFNADEYEKDKECYGILSRALACYSKNTKYVLDLYTYIEENEVFIDGSEVIVAQILPELELQI